MKFSVSVVAVLACLCDLKGIMASSYGNSGYGSNYGKYGGMSMGYGQGSYGLGYGQGSYGLGYGGMGGYGGYSGYGKGGYSGYGNMGYSGYGKMGYSGYGKMRYSGYGKSGYSGYGKKGGSIIDETIVIPHAMPVQAQMPMGGVYGGFGAGGLGSQVGLGDEYGLRKFLEFFIFR
jgi:hypothetical protein